MRASAVTGVSRWASTTRSASFSHSARGASAGAQARRATSRHAAALASNEDSQSSGARRSALNRGNGTRPLADDSSSNAERTGA